MILPIVRGAYFFFYSFTCVCQCQRPQSIQCQFSSQNVDFGLSICFSSPYYFYYYSASCRFAPKKFRKPQTFPIKITRFSRVRTKSFSVFFSSFSYHKNISFSSSLFFSPPQGEFYQRLSCEVPACHCLRRSHSREL